MKLTCDKHCYIDKSSAYLALDQTKKNKKGVYKRSGKLSVYRCRECKCWHLGHRASTQRRRDDYEAEEI